MHSINFCNTNSESGYRSVNQNSSLKIKCIGEAERYYRKPKVFGNARNLQFRHGKEAKPSTNFCERSEQIEFLNAIGFNTNGESFYA